MGAEVKSSLPAFVSLSELKVMLWDVRAKLDWTNTFNTQLAAFEHEHLELARANITSAIMQLEKAQAVCSVCGRQMGGCCTVMKR